MSVVSITVDREVASYTKVMKRARGAIDLRDILRPALAFGFISPRLGASFERFLARRVDRRQNVSRRT